MPFVKGKSATPMAEPLDVDGIVGAISGGTVDERWAAARAAADIPSGLEILSKALAAETTSRVREAIFTGLARIGTPASAEAVASYLRSNDPDVRTGALDAMRAMPEATAPHLPVLLRDDDPDVRLLACELVRNQPVETANSLLFSLLANESNANVCGAAIEVLAETGDQQALPVLKRCAERFPNDPFLAFAIGMAIDRIGSQVPSRA